MLLKWDEDLFLMELLRFVREDRAFSQILPGEQVMLLETAREVALQLARACKGLYQEPPEEIARHWGVRIKYMAWSGNGMAVRYRAQLFMRPPTIIVYKDSVDRLVCILNSLGFSAEADPARVSRLHIAHELYHYIEVKSGIRVDEVRDSVSRWCKFRNHRRTKVLSEVAASYFAQELVDFPVNPLILDWLEEGRQPDVREVISKATGGSTIWR